MQRVGKLLKKMFDLPQRPRLPAESQDMTLHDAMRICAGCVQNSAPRTARNWAPSRPLQVYWYRSESDLRNQWRRLDEAPRQAVDRTVILILGEFLCSNLRELIRKRCSADRLVIVPRAGHWPGTNSFGDLALDCGSLGWNSIEISRSLHNSPENLVSSYGQNERLLLVLPESTSATVPGVG